MALERSRILSKLVGESMGDAAAAPMRKAWGSPWCRRLIICLLEKEGTYIYILYCMLNYSTDITVLSSDFESHTLPTYFKVTVKLIIIILYSISL